SPRERPARTRPCTRCRAEAACVQYPAFGATFGGKYRSGWATLRNDVPMDAIDRKILAQLQRDGRISNVELAERVNLSPSPSLRRLKRLESPGLIEGYSALLDR